MRFAILLILMSVSMMHAQDFTRGLGVYPGDPKQFFGPSMSIDSTTYRNLALRRAAYHSSSYDYNLTATLITDGIKDTVMPRTIAVSTSAGGPNNTPGVLSRIDREMVLDDNVTSTTTLTGPKVWIQFELRGGSAPLEVDKFELVPRAGGGGRGGQQPAAQPQPGGWALLVSGSDDGQSWMELGQVGGAERPMAPGFRPIVQLSAPSRNRFVRLELTGPADTRWNLSEVFLFNKGERVKIGGPYSFTSAWMSSGTGEDWVYVDLGAPCTFDRVTLSWIRRASEGAVQVSDDAAKWTTLQALPSGPGLTDDMKLAQPAKGRYVRVLMTKAASPEGYVLSEMEVFGRGGPVARPKTAPLAQANGRLLLAGGAWRVQRDSFVRGGPDAISKVGFQDTDWVVATVPATTLVSYLNVGAIPNPDFGDNQLQISDSFFYADFWYRNEFVAPAAGAGKHVWLNFDGINWKADVYVNGEKVGRIDGGFMRGKFDVTSQIRPGVRNAIAVLVIKNATPGSIKEKTALSTGLNGGALGADNPTYHATVGWDWIPPVRGRDDGMWADVSLTSTGAVALENPFVHSTLPLPDTSRADLSVEATLRNLEARPITGTLRGTFGTTAFEAPVTLDASATKTVKLDPSTTPALRLAHPKLWWPNGYGDQYLYPVKLEFVAADKTVSDSKSFQSGVRQMTHSEEGGSLRLWVNGRRFIGRGGNWGHPESNLRYRSREYDVAVKYHKDMNFTMIRNWVGQTGDEAFYEACDKYGVMVWQDFWLANPVDGPNPDDPALFMANVKDYVLKIRNHPSMGIYVGRNEGNPPPEIDKPIRALLPEIHPGIHYISNSAMGVVSGGGPYRMQPLKNYFLQRATPKLHSEMGMPNIMTMDSIRLTMAEKDAWPQGAVWGLHDFTTAGAQGGQSFRDTIDKGYGGATSAEEWALLAQFVNYDGHRAMFEAQSKNRMGLLIWMSHPSWPTFVWQTYDYFFEPTAAYFGAKKGSEPLHIQWNPATDNVEVVNYSAGNKTGLTARVEILNMDGTRQWEKIATVDSKEDSVESPIRLEFPAGLSPTHFLRLTLSQGNQKVSSNFYMRGVQQDDFRAIRELPKVTLETRTTASLQGSRWVLSTTIRNPSKTPALLIRLKAVRATSGDRILPAIYSDNYIALMPGESRTILTEFENADARRERPRIVIEGFNTY
jgi:beta-galactosidase/beta-glucuronidase